VIQEKSGVTAGRKDFYKLPGGLVDPSEDIQVAGAPAALTAALALTANHALVCLTANRSY
jgi:hypothetical protein